MASDILYESLQDYLNAVFSGSGSPSGTSPFHFINGPDSSVNNNVVVFDGTEGNKVKDSGTRLSFRKIEVIPPTNYTSDSSGYVMVNHNLGEVPDFVLVNKANDVNQSLRVLEAPAQTTSTKVRVAVRDIDSPFNLRANQGVFMSLLLFAV